MPTVRPSGLTGAFAWLGALLFVVALLFFLYSYLVRFGRPAPAGRQVFSVVVNLLLFSLFALHHSVFARTRVKTFIRRLVPPVLERSAYTWAASALFLVVCIWWQPVPGSLYHLEGPLAGVLYAVQVTAILLTLKSSSRIDVLDLAGVRPVLDARHEQSARHVPLETTGLYGFVRHPLYFAWMLLVFGAPHMTATRLTFAIVSTVYLAVAIPLEERSLIEVFGADYNAYQRRVRWRMIPGIY
jgi:protein-S-isoprenylcysteine O-methyltransferase Ste14